MSVLPAIAIAGLRHSYGERVALSDLTLEVRRGEIFGVLGPNGGGKTTLFRLLSTLMPPQSGGASVLGYDLRCEPNWIRGLTGVVFQAPSLDKKLTVLENLWHQAALYGVSGAEFRERSTELLGQLNLTDRAGERVERLSGGTRRRVELAKGLIHRPALLLLDEPSTGLDPGARLDLWAALTRLRERFGVTVVLTTHLLEEADKCDRLAILAAGRLVALDTPDRLRAEVGGEAIVIATSDAARLADELQRRWGLASRTVDGAVRLEPPDARQWVARIMESCSELVDSITLSKPTLEDVFIARTGHRFWSETDGGRA